MFQTLTLEEEGSVGFRGGQKGNIVGMGTIGNSLISVNNFWLVNGLKHNHMSISQLCGSGYKVLFDKNLCSIINESDKSIMFKGKRKGNLYTINISELIDQKVVFLMSASDENGSGTKN